MKEIKIEEKSYLIPTSWDEVTLDQFRLIFELEDESINNKIKLFQVFIDLDRELIEQLSYDSFNEVIDVLNFVWTIDNELTEKIIEVNGIKYGLHPDLEKLTLGEWIDLEYFMKDFKTNFDKIITVILRPVVTQDENGYTIEKFNDSTFNDRLQIFRKHLSPRYVLPITNFFLNFVKESMIRSRIYSILKNQNRDPELIIKKIGVGSDISTS